MNTTIPATGWKTAQDSEKKGNIIRSKNISLDKDAQIRLARKAMVLYSLADDAGFGNPIVIETDGTYIYVLTSNGHHFVVNVTLTSFSIIETSATNSPTLGNDSDWVIFNNKPHASGAAKVGYINALGQGQVWHSPSPITDLSTDYPHPMLSFQNNNLFVGDGNTLRQYNTSYVRDTSNELLIGSEFIITGIRSVGSKLYVSTRHKYGGEARLFVWNRVGTAAQESYGCGADWIYSMCEYDSSLAVITSAGELARFNGGGFDPLAYLPVYFTEYSWSSTAADSSLIGKVASRGMRASGKKLYINLDGSINQDVLVYPGPYLAEQPSGLYCYDPDVGLYHKAGYNYNSKILNLITEINSNILKFGTAHQAQTGDPVLYSGGEVSGLNSGQVYYAITESSLTLQLALSPEDARAGKAVVVSATSLVTSRCYFDRYESIGETSISAPGGLCVMARNFLNGFYASEVVFGGSALDETLTAKGVLMSLGMGRNRASFVTPKISSADILDTFQRIVSFFEGLYGELDEIVIKWRKAKRSNFPVGLCYTGSATWVAANQFTLDFRKKDMLSVAEGDEIEIVRGAGAGYTAHIETIDDSAAPIYTITIDEDMPVTSGSFDFIVDNWKKLIVIDKDSESSSDNYADPAVDTKAKWVEFKVELRGRGVAIDEMQFINAVQKLSK